MGPEVVSNVIAGLALLFSIVQFVHGRRRQNALSDAQHELHTELTQVVVKLSHHAVGEIESKDVAQVRWTVEHVRKSRWLLRNIGAVVARNVQVDKEALGGVGVNLEPDLPADIEPGESVTILAVGAWARIGTKVLGAPVADEVRVTWGEDEQAVVPLPRWH